MISKDKEKVVIYLPRVSALTLSMRAKMLGISRSALLNTIIAEYLSR